MKEKSYNQYIKHFESYGLRPKLLTVKSNAENDLIDFENNFYRRNVDEIEVNKCFEPNKYFTATVK